VFTALFHPDGTRIASGGRDRAVWLWDPDSSQEVAHLPPAPSTHSIRCFFQVA
jgi:hypothetical protein